MGFNFTLDLTKFCQKAKIAPAQVVKKVAFDIYAAIVAKTPVDTGRARANWQIGLNKMPTGTIDEGFKGTKGGWKEGKRSFGKAMGGAAAPVAAGSKDLLAAALQAGTVIYIANNVEYIKALEDGHSKQAPAGMVKTTIARFDAYVKNAAGSL